MKTRKTTSDAINDVISMLKRSDFTAFVNGNIYKGQNRPINSTKEDIVVDCIYSNFEQVQRFSVNINVFVPRIEGEGENVYLQDTKRIDEISAELGEFVENINDKEYKIEPANAVNFDSVDAIGQDYVNITLRLFRISQ